MRKRSKDPLGYRLKRMVEWLLIQQVPTMVVILLLLYWWLF